MCIRSFGFALLAAGLGALACGCNKSKPAAAGGEGQNTRPQAAALQSPAQPSVSRLHWMGKKRLGGETNATYLMSIWNLPESVRLEAQTLDKLALAPWRAQLTNELANLTNYQPLVASHPLASLLRPLLQDLVEQECYLEIRQVGTNAPCDLAFAIRLDPGPATSWETNLAAVAEGLGGGRVNLTQTNGAIWQMEFAVHGTTSSNRTSDGHSASQGSSAKCVLNLTRSADWTIVGLASGSDGFARELAQRVQSHPRGTPLVADGTNAWIDADLDLRHAAAVLGQSWRLPINPPRLELTVAGDGQNVRTRAELEFPQPLPLELEPWNVPTDHIHDPLIGFSAVRGIRPLLVSFKPWNDLQLGTPPNQAFFWAQAGAFFLHFLALPSADASNQVMKLSSAVLHDLNPIFALSKMGTFEEATNAVGIIWRGIPLFSPTLQYLNSNGPPLVFAGFSRNRLTERPAPPALIQQLHLSTNLVWYDWEITGPCLEGLTAMNQLTRRIFGCPRLPPHTAGLAWLLALPAKLGNSATTLKLETPARLSFARNSSIGLTAEEIEVLVDWLECSTFPKGLHTLEKEPSSARP